MPKIVVRVGLSPGTIAARMENLAGSAFASYGRVVPPTTESSLAQQGAPIVQLNIAVRHGHLSEATQDKLKSRVEKLGRYFDRLMAIEIVVDMSDAQAPQVDIKVSAEHKHDFLAHEKTDNLLSAVDAAVQKIEQQLRKYKERVQQKHRNSQLRRQELPMEEESTEG